MTTSHRITIETESGQPDRRLSFREKVREHFKKGKPKDEYAKPFARFLFVFQASTQLYTTLSYLVGHTFRDSDPWTRYYVKVLACYLCIQTVANWLCTLFYDTSFRKTKDRPEYEVGALYDNNPDHFVARLESLESNGTIPSNSKTEDWAAWTLCTICNIYIPPRAHHCDYCKKCILKRDHHCFMIGNCIGFKNQRYFVVLTFYSAIVCLAGGFFTARYLLDNFMPHGTYSDLFLPVTAYRFLFGDIDFKTLLMIYHSYIMIPFGLISCLYFASQMLIIAQGVTLYELSKQMTVKCTRPVNENFKSVFGDFWALNFLFPAQLIFRQREDGKSWDGIKVVKKPKPAVIQS